MTKTEREPCPAWRIEDFLQKQMCFVKHNDDKKIAHLDSYLTVFEFRKLDRCLKKAKRCFTQEQWKNVIEYWASNAYLSPNQALLSKIANRIVLKGGIDGPEKETDCDN